MAQGARSSTVAEADRPAAGRLTALRAWGPCLGVAAALLLLWLRPIWSLFGSIGLFSAIGMDYAMYVAQSAVLRFEDPSSLYDLTVIERQLQRFAPYSGVDGAYLKMGPVAYPPLFSWLLTPFTYLSPPVGFAIWTAIGVAAGIFLAIRAARFFPDGDRRWVVVLVATSFPVIYSLFLAQVTVLLAVAMAECYLCLRAGRDGRAGLWLACLAIKPHYALLIGAVLLWKRRWRAVAGAAIGGALVLLGSLVVAGPSALLAWPSVLSDVSQFDGAGGATFPAQMINWRGAILRAAPTIPADLGIFLTSALGLVTVLAAAVVWRGPWSPGDRSFPQKFAVLLIATLLATYHGHAHGAVLLTVPLAHALAERAGPWLAQRAIVYSAWVPTVAFTVSMNAVATSAIVQALMLVMLAGLLVSQSGMQPARLTVGRASRA